MKNLTKFLCILVITVFLSSCASSGRGCSSGSGCYVFENTSKKNTGITFGNAEFESNSKKENNTITGHTICAE